MEQKITGYHLDHEDHWVAELECGHGQHVRHDPPWQVRDWVVTHFGSILNCVRCDEMGMAIAKKVIARAKVTLLESYESAGISGLCEEGRLEVAIGSLDSIPLRQLIEEAISKTKS
jgi:hypothetical protein